MNKTSSFYNEWTKKKENDACWKEKKEMSKKEMRDERKKDAEKRSKWKRATVSARDRMREST